MDWSTIVVSAFSLVGTLAGTFGGILASQKLSNYRIEQLETKVDRHNSIIERTFKLEEDATHFHEDMKDLKERVHKLESA